MCPIFSVLVGSDTFWSLINSQFKDNLILGWQKVYSKANFQDSVFFILLDLEMCDVATS